MDAGAFDQQIQHGRRIFAPVDVVAKKDMNGLGYRVLSEVRVDPRKQFFEQIGPAVDVADGIDSQPVWHDRPRFRCLGAM